MNGEYPNSAHGMDIGHVGLSRAFWLRTLVLLPVALGLHVLVEDRADLGADTGAVGAFVTAVGTLYSVLTAFTVVSVWTQFTDTDRAVKREARALGELWRYVGYLGDANGVREARKAIESYRSEVLAHEWAEMATRSEVASAEEEFFAMADAVNGIGVTSAKDVPAWAEAVRTLGEVGDARGDRLVQVRMRMPSVLRALLYLATVSLVAGMGLLGFEHVWIGALVVGMTVVVSLLVLEVIDDIDDPFGGAWGITEAPLRDVAFAPSGREPATDLLHEADAEPIAGG